MSKNRFLAPHLNLPIKNIAISAKLATPKLRSDLTRRGIAMWCRTVRKPAELRPLVKVKVDGIITDIATQVRKLLTK